MRIKFVPQDEGLFLKTLYAFSAGILLYFQLGFEVPHFLTAVVLTGGFLLWNRTKAYKAQRYLFVIFMSVLGFSYSQLYTVSLDTEFIAEETYLSGVSATIVQVSNKETGERLKLQLSEGRGGLSPGAYLLIDSRFENSHFEAGQKGKFNLVARPPNRRPSVGDYDQRRAAYFGKISGYGFLTEHPTELTLGSNQALPLHTFKAHLNQTFQSQLNRQAAALLAALTLGDKSYFSSQDTQTFRQSGLAHLLAISGLHMGIVMFGSFYIVELLLVLILPVRMSKLPRKIAILFAVAVGASYLILSGLSLSAERAFIMGCVGLTALWFERPVLSLRTVILAAFLILAVEPVALLSVGFQLSFAAASALVIVFMKRTSNSPHEKRQNKSRIISYFQNILLVTLVAQISVAPFTLFHFQEIPLLGPVANIVVVPIVTLFLLPLAILSLLFDFLGIFWILAPLLNFLSYQVFEIASFVASFPSASITFQKPSIMFSLSVLIVLLLFFTVKPVTLKNGRLTKDFTAPWFLSLMVIACIALLSFPKSDSPTFILDGKRPTILTAEGGHFSGYHVRDSSFKTDSWKKSFGQNGNIEKRLKPICDSSGCLFFIREKYKLATPKTLTALSEDCLSADVILLRESYFRDLNSRPTSEQVCSDFTPSKNSPLIIAEEQLLREGPAFIYIDSSQLNSSKTSKHVIYSNPPEKRPWSQRATQIDPQFYFEKE